MEKQKHAFTLTELVIVIAVIAILAAVLIPVYQGLIRKANQSADIQAAKNFNSIIVDDSSIKSMQDVMDAFELDAKYEFKNFNPSSEGYRFAWEQKSNQIVLFNKEFDVVHNEKTIPNDCQFWLTVRSNEKNQFEDVVGQTKVNFNYFLANDLKGNFELTTLSSFSTGRNTLEGNVTLNTNETGKVTIDGNIQGTLTINAVNADVTQDGVAQTVVLNAVKGNSLHVKGFVEELRVAGVGHVVLESHSYVKNLAIKNDLTAGVKIDNETIVGNVFVYEITENGGIQHKTNNTALPVTFNNTSGYVENTKNLAEEAIVNPGTYEVQIKNLKQLEAFRDRVNNGATYENITVRLMTDITLKNGWTPIGEFTRDTENGSPVHTGFSGIFEGNGKTILNLNNSGYEANSNALFSNTTTLNNKKQYGYGFFGLVTNATIKDLNFKNVRIDIPCTETTYGDSVGTIIGHSWGNLTLDNCKVIKGTVSAYDGVGGLVGRSYAKTVKVDNDNNVTYNKVEIKNCENNANVTGAEKAAGILGYGCTDVTIRDTINNGAIKAISQVRTANNTSIAAGLITYGSGPIKIIDCTNTGNITVNYITVDRTGGDTFAIHYHRTRTADVTLEGNNTIGGTLTINDVIKNVDETGKVVS